MLVTAVQEPWTSEMWRRAVCQMSCRSLRNLLLASCIYSCCLMTFPYPLPKSVLHTVRSSASPFNLQYLSFPCHLVAAYAFFLVFPSRLSFFSTFPSVTCFRRQFPRKMWPIQLAFLLLPYVRYSSPPWLGVILRFSHERFNWLSPSSPAPHFRNFKVFSVS